jgi:hypothetical protein
MMTINESPYQPEEYKQTQSGGCLNLVVFIMVWFWMVIISLGRLGSQLLASGALTQVPDAYWAAFPAIQGIFIVLILLPLAIFWRSQPWRSIYQTWLAAALFILLLAPISLIPPAAMQLHSVLNILLSVVFTGAVIFFSRRAARTSLPAQADTSTHPLRNSSAPYGLALLFVGMIAYPWLAWGALGSLLDTLLQVLAGVVLGTAFAATLQFILLPGFDQNHASPARLFSFGGFAAGGALFLFATGAGYAFGGVQTLLAIMLPPLGWAAVRLFQLHNPSEGQPTASWRGLFSPATLLIGLAIALPLVLVDPDELALIISASAGEILFWALAAAGVSAGIAFIIAGGLRITLNRSASQPASTSSPAISGTLIAAALVWIIGAIIYFLAGQPGFYGEGLLVVLKDQTDVASAVQISDLVERRRFVYTTLTGQANATQTSLRASLDRLGVGYTPYYLVNAIQVDGGPLLKFWLSARPEVDRVLDNPFMRPLPRLPAIASANQTKPESPQWNLTQINAPRVWQELGVRGEGIVIGQSDSGVQYDHPELADSYRGRDGVNDYNWFDPWYDTPQPTDIGGHGTHTLGTALGNSTGVAPDAQWIACANLVRNLGNPGYYLDCMQFMLAPFPLGSDPLAEGDPSLGANVLNNSWGCPPIEGCDPGVFLPAVRALNSAGVFVVASAGNDGPFCASVKDPLALYDGVLSVGATNSLGDLTSFSSRGPVTVDGSNRTKPDIIAPGDMVLSSFPNNTYNTLPGTSMAGPHAVGVVALMWSANPRLIGDIPRTFELLEETAQHYQGSLPNCAGADSTPSTAVGYGVLDAYAAVQAALQAP